MSVPAHTLRLLIPSDTKEETSMWWITYVVAPILGGIIALSGLIAKKAPNAQEMLNKILPYKAFIGVGLLVMGVWNLIDIGGDISFIFKASAMLGISVIIVIAAELLLGFMLGMPQIAKWIPGDSNPEVKAAELSKKLIAFEIPIGFLGVLAGVLMLLFRLNIIGPG